jgi:hypothetical protein
LPRFFGQADGIRFKQAVRLELCGVALKLLQYVPNLENGKIYSLLGFFRADINGVIFSLSDYQLTEECSQ